MVRLTFIGTLFFMLTAAMLGHAQEKENEKKSNGFTKVSKKVKGLIYQNPGDTIMDEKSESVFIRYEGKIIRSIIINRIGFEKNINDTTKSKVRNKVARLANKVHDDTEEQVIRNNLFFKENKPLDPYKLADNERYLRDLNFIVDARILVKPVRGKRDQVDVIVVTRDVFSIGGSFNPSSPTASRFKIYDANLDGWGQRLQFNGLVDSERNPNFGYQLLYNKNSIKGSFINATVSYTQLNSGASYGLENENAVFVKLDRPLVSPYTRWAGGAELSRNWSENVYGFTEDLFREYKYYVRDFWIGYNIGIKNKTANRNRHFVGVRTFNQSFSEQPVQSIEELNPIYNDQKYVLGELTFYNQNFYRTKYVYGFGRTEDVPYGKRVTLLAGKVKQLGYTRTYVGVEADKSIVRKNGDFREYSVKLGGFKNGSWEDIVLVTSASLYSKLIPWKQKGVRQSVSLSYATIFNPTVILPLRLDNEYGISNFRADSLLGNKRLSMRMETTIFLKPKVLGFHFAPFVFNEMALLAPKGKSLFNEPAYFGLGGGVRTRNENLIFGTIELRFIYFPRVTEDFSNFKITLASNLRVKYSSGFVKAPAFIRYN